jgi:integrase
LLGNGLGNTRFATAVEDGVVRANPLPGVRIPSAPASGDIAHEDHAKALTRAELAWVLDELPVEWRLFFELLAHTGLRISEAIGLTWEHVELGPRPRILVREQFYRGKRRKLKSRHGRRNVPLSPGMVERLGELRRDTYGGDKAPVFPSTTGTELHPSNVARRVLKPAAAVTGLPWVRLPYLPAHVRVAAL